jgi:hypothetical protein
VTLAYPPMLGIGRDGAPLVRKTQLRSLLAAQAVGISGVERLPMACPPDKRGGRPANRAVGWRVLAVEHFAHITRRIKNEVKPTVRIELRSGRALKELRKHTAGLRIDYGP